MNRKLTVVPFVFLLTIILYRIPFVRKSELIIYDWKMRLSAKPSSEDIVLVEIDQHSLDFYDEQFHITFPWPRGLYGRAVRFFSEAGARLIALDMIFSEADRNGDYEDQYLAQSIKEAGNVFLPILLGQGSSTPENLQRFALPESYSRQAVELKGRGAITAVMPLFEAQAGGGNVMTSLEEGGVTRSLRHIFRFRKKLYPSLPLAMARYIRGDIDIDRVPCDSRGRLSLKFYDFRRGIFRVSICDAIQSQVRIEEEQPPVLSPDRFRGKIVIVGATAPGLLDLRPSPLNTQGSGFEILATSLLNFLESRYIRHINEAVFWPVLLLCLFVQFLWIHRLSSIQKQIPASSLFIFISVVMSIFLFTRFSFEIPMIPPVIAFLAIAVIDGVFRYNQLRREKRRIKGAFETYLSPQMLDYVMGHPDVLAMKGDRREVTVFFSDFAGFTTLAETLSAEKTVSILNQYLGTMTDVIIGESRGWVHKYEGDAIMALWGALMPDPKQAERAVKAALKCMEELNRLNKENSTHGYPPLQMRIGINSGEVVVGNIGSHRSQRLELTVIGDAVNLASRLEGINKQYGSRVICGSRTAEMISREWALRRLDRVRVKGKNLPEEIFEVIGENITPEIHEELLKYEKALDHYFLGEFEAALGLLSLLSGDPAANNLADRCRRLLNNPPEKWDGIWSYSVK